MKLRNQTVTDFAAGDHFRLRRFYTMPSGSAVTQAHLVIKADDDDADNQALIWKTINPINQSDKGQVVDDGSGGVCELAFNLLPADTKLLVPSRYYWIIVNLSTGEENTAEDGKILARKGGRQTVTP